MLYNLIKIRQGHNLREVDYMKYFKNIRTLEELRKEYKKLLKQFHPDNGGSEEATKEINLEYEKLFEMLKNCKNCNQKEKEEFNKEFDQAFRDILNQVIDLNVDVEIIGSWIWVGGNTYAIKETLKRLGFNWIGKRKMWAWHEEEYTKRRNSNKTLDELRNYYGSEIVKQGKKNDTYKALAC